MAIVVMFDVEGATAAQYDEVSGVLLKSAKECPFRVTFRWEGNHAHEVRCEDDHS